MKRFSLYLVVLSIFLLPGLLVSQRRDVHSVESPSSTRAAHRDFQVIVQTLGTLHAVNSHLVSSQIKGTGAKIIFLAPDGYPVEKGDVLVRFDPAPFEEVIVDLSARIDDLSAGVEAAEQLLEWEKTEVVQQNATALYNLKVARLDLQRLVKGDGPMTIAQYRDERDKAQLELKRYQDYAKELKKLAKDGYANPAEQSRVRDNIDVSAEKFAGAGRRYTSYQDFVLPSLTESARAKVQNAELSLQQSKQAGVHKIARAKAGVQQVKAKLKTAQTALKQAESELDKTVLRAPFSGLLIHYETYRNGEMRTAREGDTVIINQPILYLPDIASLVVKSEIREIDLHKVAVSQQATITVEAYPDISFQGTLSFIGALAKKQAGHSSREKFFQVHFSLNREDKRLRPGMSSRVAIQTADLQQTLSLPVEAVFLDSDGPFCYLQTGNGLTVRRLQTGHNNQDFIEITNGLEGGETVSMVRPDTY